jgi:hypothetical protein
VWFAEELGNKIGRITTAGAVSEYPVPTTGSSPGLITAGPDGALWFTEFYGNNIARAPACGLGFTANFANGTLTMNFNLGIDTPATFGVLALNASGAINTLFERHIPAIVPPKAFTLIKNSFPNLGTVTLSAGLDSSPGQVICAEWTTVNAAQ